MIDTVKEIIREDDLILFKASHGMNFSGAIDTLFGTDIGETSSMGHKEYAAEKDGDFLYYVFEYHATVKEYYGQESKVVLPEAFSGLPVEKLGKSVFKDSSTIEEAVLPDSMVRLRGYCFKNSSLKSVTFGKNLKQIGAGTFQMCKNLEEVALPEGLLLIGHKAFAECENLKEIYIPESVKRISKTAFSGSENTVILCEKDSYAERYAEKHGMQCRTAK